MIIIHYICVYKKQKTMKTLFNKVFFFLLLVLSLITSSCDKHDNDFHRVRFHLTFMEVPPVGSSDFIEVSCSPNYDNDPPRIYKDYITPGYEWDYEFWQLKNGDEVKFIVNPQLYYWFVMEVYVDDVLVSTREVVTSSQTYYATETLTQTGLNNDEETNFPVISFYYNE